MPATIPGAAARSRAPPLVDAKRGVVGARAATLGTSGGTGLAGVEAGGGELGELLTGAWIGGAVELLEPLDGADCAVA